jgi:hypothetical protein
LVLTHVGAVRVHVCVPCRVADHAKVFVNGNWVGIVPDAEHIAQVIRSKRRENLIEFEVSVYRDIPNQEVRASWRGCPASFSFIR